MFDAFFRGADRAPRHSVRPVDFEWDSAKARENRQRHGVSFLEASTVLDDPLARSYRDPDHSWDEDRSITLGRSRWQRVLVVIHTDRGEITRIISARPASPRERRHYEEG